MIDEWLIYALGGGWGHITRALSLGRIAVNNHRRVSIITNSPYINRINCEGCRIKWIPENTGFSETCAYVEQILARKNYTRLIIDTFPRGLGGELVNILPYLRDIPRILIHRDINPNYVIAKELVSFVRENFNLVIVPGEGEDLAFCQLPNVKHTAPWLIRNHQELSEISFRRSHLLQVSQSSKLILICAGGQASELSVFSQLAIQLQHCLAASCVVRILAADCPDDCPEALWRSYHPGIECIAAADIVVGGAGYNTVYECTSLGVPLVALAFPRLYDRQSKRAKKCHFVQNIPEAIACVKTLINQVKSPKTPSIPLYINGAILALHHIINI